MKEAREENITKRDAQTINKGFRDDTGGSSLNSGEETNWERINYNHQLREREERVGNGLIATKLECLRNCNSGLGLGYGEIGSSLES